MVRGYVMTCLICAAIASAATIAGAASATAPAQAQPASAPARKPPAAANAPVPDPLIVDASAALDNATLPDFQKIIEAEIAPLLADLDHADNAQLIHLCVYREFARLFGPVKDMEQKERDTLKWLLSQPRLFRTLMLAMSDRDRPKGVLAVLRQLHEDVGDQLENYPDLTAAMCVTWDEPTLESGQIDLAHVDRLFHYYLNSGDVMRFDLAGLPWQLAIYVVSNPVSEDQIAWALNRYRGYHGPIGHVYFDVAYDTEAFYSGAKERIDAHEYTLANLIQYGGICKDQAHFATAVGRTLGVPIVTCLGVSNDGILHAWVGFLEVSKGHVRWNFSEGRYPDDQFWQGMVQSPQTGEQLSDADVSLLAELQSSKPDDRDASVALWKLRTIAKADQLLPLFIKAIELSPGNRDAWMSLADLGAQQQLSSEQMNAVMDVVKKFALGKYDSFAYAMFTKLVSGEATAEQIASLDRAVQLFKDRPDLLADIRMRQADLLRDDKPEDALRAYGEVLTHYLNAGPIVYQAMMKVDAMLQSMQEFDRLAAIYKQVWTAMPQPVASIVVKTTPWYVIGEHYAALLDEMGQKQTAVYVRSKLSAMLPPRPAWEH